MYNADRRLSLTKEIKAVYEHGVIRPLQPLELAEGARLDVIIITHEETETIDNPAEILAEIAALPLEGSSDVFADREHDSIHENRNQNNFVNSGACTLYQYRLISIKNPRLSHPSAQISRVINLKNAPALKH